uniref:Uncharacterized protein n=1 Tax=Knipowitschia caucasica TaxID=637954 RepID=A0AAV2MDN2_KNICA
MAALRLSVRMMCHGSGQSCEDDCLFATRLADRAPACREEMEQRCVAVLSPYCGATAGPTLAVWLRPHSPGLSRCPPGCSAALCKRMVGLSRVGRAARCTVRQD